MKAEGRRVGGEGESQKGGGDGGGCRGGANHSTAEFWLV